MRNELLKIINSHFCCQTPELAYYSERSVQLKMGIEIFKITGNEPVLEKKVSGLREYIDFFINNFGHRIGIELKYKTLPVYGFDYESQGASNLGKQAFIYDIKRLEALKEINLIDKGYAILITNDKTYWSRAREGSLIKKFDLLDKNILTGIYHLEKKNGHYPPIILKENYDVNWYKTPVNQQGNVACFSYCIVEV